jgi:glycosyltransferase involved in cell wall biosynthesis
MILRRELGVLPNELLIVAVGNLYPVKGHAVLLRALAGLVHDAPATPWRLAIAGRGEAEAALRSFASEAGIADRVHLLGFRTDVADILAAADVFVMPSLSEGLPLALVEAMSASLPIVASDVGGIPEVVERDAEALLTPPDDAGAIAEALARLLADADMRAALGAAAGRRALRDFGVERMGDAYERLYRTPRWGTSGPAGSGVVAAPVSRDGR